MTKTIRKNGKWAQVSKVVGGYCVAKGYEGDFKSVHNLVYPFKYQALDIGKLWIASK